MVEKPMKYFDHAASSMIFPTVLEVLTKSLKEDFANPSAKHLLGHKLHEQLSYFREDFLKSLGGKPDDFFSFTSSASESNNTVILGFDFNEGDTVLYSKADHPSLVEPIEKMALEKKLELKEIPLNPDGQIHFENFESLLDQKVKMVLLTHVNSQSGVIQDIEKLSLSIKAKSSAHVHVDMVQSFGKISLPALSRVDSLSVSSHKLGGPKGIAGLYLKKNHKIKPLLLGGGQESGMRSSTEAYPLIAGFHAAMKTSLEDLDKAFIKMKSFSQMLHSELSKVLPMKSPFVSSSPYIVTFILPGIPSDVILRHLEMKDVYISSTSACSSKISGFNPTLNALHIPERFHKNMIRISMWQKTTQEDVEGLIHEFLNVWASIKHMQKN
jgi:cysteine desulfurase